MLIEEHDPLHDYSAITSQNVLDDRSDASGIWKTLWLHDLGFKVSGKNLVNSILARVRI